MANPKGFRHPSEMEVPVDRTPVSARVKLATKETLEKRAKTYGLSLGLLISNVLDDYAAWLDTEKKKN